MIGIGALVGVGLILLDTVLGAANKLRIPPLAVGSARVAQPDSGLESCGTLVASGFIVGESLWGVLNAGLIVGLSTDAPIGLVPDSFAPGPWQGIFGIRRHHRLPVLVDAASIANSTTSVG